MMTDFDQWQEEKAKARMKLLQLPADEAQRVASAINPDAVIEVVDIPKFPKKASIGEQ